MTETILQQIARFLSSKNRILVLSHVRPDGDAVGSMLALTLALRSAGKQVDAVSVDPPPHDFRSLPGVDSIRVEQAVDGVYGAVVILECNSVSRTGVTGFEGSELINIDHHESAEPFGQLNWFDPSFGAVGQMVFRLIETMKISVTPEIATNLYVALVTDTGNFQFANTTAVELADAGRLVQCGAVPADISKRIYQCNTHQRILLLGRVLSTLEIDGTKRVAWVHLPQDMLRETGASPADTEGIVNHLLSIETVEVAAFFRQESADCCKLSLRSKGDLDVSQIALSFQGGGHKNAAGFTVHDNLEGSRQRVLLELRKLLNHEPGRLTKK